MVVAEIFRVLKDGGCVYAETPFMQQVHEGAFDFSRFTVLGHRYLFKKFRALGFGGMGGAEQVVSWSLRYATWSIFRNRMIGRMVGIGSLIILSPLKLFSHPKAINDNSSGVYFLGIKDASLSLSHKDLISLYDGLM